MGSIDILISLVLSLIMFGIGSSLEAVDFKTIFRNLKPFATGLMLQMFFLPAFALSIAFFSNLSPEFKTGLFIISICPGGVTSNFISYLVKADVALSISLTTFNSILILFTIPLFSNFALSIFLGGSLAVSNVSVYNTFLQVLFILLIPVILGVFFNEFFNELSKKIQNLLKIINTLLLALIFGVKFLADDSSGGSGISQDEVALILPYCLLLHIGSMLISYFFSKKISISNHQSATIGIEVGLQNTTLALLVTGVLIGNNEMTKPALVFAIFSFFTTVAFALIVKDREVNPKYSFGKK